MLSGLRTSLLNPIIILGVLLVGRLSWWTEPYGTSVDESTYLTIANTLIDGGVLYKDAVDRKPPALFWFYEGVARLFGDWSMAGVHSAALLLTLFLVWAIFRLSKEAYPQAPPKAFLFTAFLFAAYSSCFPREIISMNAELLMMALLAVSFLCFARGLNQYSLTFIFLATLMACLSTLAKQYAALIYAPVYLAWVLLEKPRTRATISFHLKACLVSIAALVAVYGSVALVFWRQGAIHEFLYYSVSNGLQYVRDSRQVQNQDTSGWLAILGMLVSWPLLWWGQWRASFYSPVLFRILMWAGAFGAAVTIFLSGRYYSHYFLPLIWFLCLLSGVPLAETFLSFSVKKTSIAKRYAFALALVLPVMGYCFFHLERDRLTPKVSFSRIRQHELKEIASFIRAETPSNSQLVVWGMASQIYVLAERKSGTRFVFADFVSGRQPGYRSQVSLPIPGAEETFLLDLESKRPFVFVDTSTANLNDYGFFPLSRFPQIEKYVKDHYTLKKNLDNYGIWFRKTSK